MDLPDNMEFVRYNPCIRKTYFGNSAKVCAQITDKVFCMRFRFELSEVTHKIAFIAIR